jgi:hypothetical protein
MVRAPNLIPTYAGCISDGQCHWPLHILLPAQRAATQGRNLWGRPWWAPTPAVRARHGVPVQRAGTRPAPTRRVGRGHAARSAALGHAGRRRIFSLSRRPHYPASLSAVGVRRMSGLFWPKGFRRRSAMLRLVQIMIRMNGFAPKNEIVRGTLECGGSATQTGRVALIARHHQRQPFSAPPLFSTTLFQHHPFSAPPPSLPLRPLLI